MKKRVGWRVDAKWVAGILFTISLLIWTIFFNLYQLTSFKQAKNIIEAVLEEPISQFVDKSYPLMLIAAQINPEKTLTPPKEVPFNIEIKGRDVTGKTPEQLEKHIINQIATQIYNEGLESVVPEKWQATQKYPEGPPQKQQALSPGTGSVMFSIMNLFTAKSNRLFGMLLIISTIFTVLFLGLLVGFSYRFGRALSLGICLSVVGLWGTLFFSSAKLGATLPPNEKYLNILRQPAANILTTYATVLIVGAVLIVTGIVGESILWITNK